MLYRSKLSPEVVTAVWTAASRAELLLTTAQDEAAIYASAVWNVNAADIQDSTQETTDEATAKT